ncbi:MAG TPA: glycosyltransferase family 4 protein [Longimicrobiales bacterium]
MKTLFLTQDFPPDHGGIARLYAELCLRFPAGGVEVVTVRAPDDAAGGVAASGDAGARAYPRPGEVGAAARGRPARASAGAAGRGRDRTRSTPAHATAGVAGGATRSAAPYILHRLPFTFREARRLSSVVRWTRWTRRRLAAGDVAVLQVGNIRPTGYVAAWLHARAGVPYVLYVHGKDLMKEERKAGRSRRARATGRWVLGGAAAVIANSRATAARAEQLLRALGLDPAGRVRVVHPGTDPARFRPDAPGADAWRSRLGLDGRRVLLSVSRLMPRKGVDTALDALALLASERPDVVYVVAGDGPERARLERRAAELGLVDRVRFPGAVDEAALPGLYAAADVFVLPVREERDDDEVEGFGIVFCEAAAAGLPVVAGDSGGVADAVRDGETAFLVPPRDPAATAAALARLLDDDALRLAMGRAGRLAAETYYHWDRAAAEAWAVLEEVAARPTGGATRRVHGQSRAIGPEGRT